MIQTVKSLLESEQGKKNDLKRLVHELEEGSRNAEDGPGNAEDEPENAVRKSDASENTEDEAGNVAEKHNESGYGSMNSWLTPARRKNTGHESEEEDKDAEKEELESESKDSIGKK